MDFSISQEVYVFLASTLCGLCIGVVYDLMRVIRSCAKPSRSITDIEDIVFWGIAVIIMFFTIFHTNAGKVRWYEFLGAILGSILYFFTVSKLFCFILKKLIEIFSKIFAFFCKILLTPLLFTYNIIYKSIIFIFAPFLKLLMRFFRKSAFKIKSGAKNTKNTLLKK